VKPAALATVCYRLHIAYSPVIVRIFGLPYPQTQGVQKRFSLMRKARFAVQCEGKS
jgi:hypothetical protein